MINRILFWINNSRLYSLHMTLLSWIVVFVFAIPKCDSIKDYLLGFSCLIAIACCQMATNLLDDYFDYKDLSKKGGLNNNTRAKCAYITSGEATLEQLFGVICIYLGIAATIGAILLYLKGLPILYFALAGAVMVLGYQKMSTLCLSEVAVFLAFGPIFFGGVYYVMTQSYSVEIFLIGSFISLFTTGLLYTHTVLDYDGDKTSCKRTLCGCFPTKNKAVIGLALIYLLAYVILILGVVFKFLPPIMLISGLIAPMVCELILLLILYNENKNSLPNKKFWHFPMENLDKLEEKGLAPFMFRFYLARNVMIYTSILICVAKVISVYF